MYLRQDMADIRLSVDGGPIGGSWATYTGGTVSAAGAKTRPGGMGREVELGGPATRSDVTITTQNEPGFVAIHPSLESRCGRADAVIAIQYLDNEGVAIPGASFRVKGKLKEADLPDYNHQTADAGMYTVVVACDELHA